MEAGSGAVFSVSVSLSKSTDVTSHNDRVSRLVRQPTVTPSPSLLPADVVSVHCCLELAWLWSREYAGGQARWSGEIMSLLRCLTECVYFMFSFIRELTKS